jgi:DNA polymerase
MSFMDRKTPVKIYGGKLTENVVQALARAIIADQMVKVGVRHHVPLQVHDEIVGIINEGQEDVARKFITGIMSTPPAWASDLPLSCEFGVGKSYGDAK